VGRPGEVDAEVALDPLDDGRREIVSEERHRGPACATAQLDVMSRA
jgi:hypothetical protein